MKTKNYIIANGNEAAAHIAYKTNEVCAIYPITPSSGMSELVAEWSAVHQENIYGSVPSVFEMQSEGGVAGALHGALQTGSLATTFTASQGLLLMMPNMYKIAGELTPNVIHVATRSVATHALSVFGDHSDIMAVRNTGYAFLGAASVQEAMDFALIAQASTLACRIPFVHFFDGFRTSHETAKIEVISDEIIREMIGEVSISEHKNNALNPNNPIVRGTTQGADVFFQSREAVNSYYDICPERVQQKMDQFALLTGRHYNLFDYVGHPNAEQVIVAMASATETTETTVKDLNAKGEKTGLIKVRLYRPFSAKHLINALPDSCTSIAVLDRTKEPGASGEPLYLDVLQAVAQDNQERTSSLHRKVVGGRYGLSSKEFTPGMVEAVFDNLKDPSPKNSFTVGIKDNVTKLSLPFSEITGPENKDFQAIFYQTKSEKSISGFDNIVKLAAAENFVQGYTECDYKKSNSRNVAHLRISAQPIKAPYLIMDADFVVCESVNFIKNDNALERIKWSGSLLVTTALSPEQLWQELSPDQRELIEAKHISVYTINSDQLASDYVAQDLIFSSLHACFVSLNQDMIKDESLSELRNYITAINASDLKTTVVTSIEEDHFFSNTFLGKLLANRGNELPVGMFPVDGTYPSDTSKYGISNVGATLPVWDAEACIQCGACSLACPQGVIRMKVFDDDLLAKAPTTFKAVTSLEIVGDVDLLNFALQADPEHCTSCSNCLDACPAKALTMNDRSFVIAEEQQNWKFLESIPEFDRTKIEVSKVSQQQLQEPLFKYSLGVDGCGEAPYLKLMSQLFGDRMLVANATGASSIFGGALPTTPWSKNDAGRGPAWSNSLFEDNAEFGLGFRLSLDHQEVQAKNLLRKLMNKLDFDLVHDITTAVQQTELQISEQRERVALLKAQLKSLATTEAHQLMNVADSLVKKSVWIVGGDGWAYDIGYGGLDHVLASGKNVNILVLDNEVYSNTGGQMSKATPFGASAKFAINGKDKQKKDLGLMAMNYEDVYVASVAIGADQEQTLKAFLEAERFEGPSIIIAYSHSPAHGIDMKRPGQYHKAAVASGQWLLYRNNPERRERNLNTLQLDSAEPSLPIEHYLKLERRFSQLFQGDNPNFRPLIRKIQNYIDRRYDNYLNRATYTAPNKIKLRESNGLHKLLKLK